MAAHCAHCNSANVSHGLQTFTCFDCGEQTDYEGRARAGRGARRVVETGEAEGFGSFPADVDRDLDPDYDEPPRSPVPDVAGRDVLGDQFTTRSSLSS